MSKLRISDSLSLPIDAVTQKFGILGRTGSGKTYGSQKIAEEMLDAKAQIVALDPVGVWYGLRVAKDGRGEGYKIPVLGGMHGDIPLEPGAGTLIADLIVDREISAVVDVSGFLIGEQRRFATDFAVQLFHRKKSKRSALHLFVEEAQEFVPQHVRGDVAKMVGAFERLLKLGRNFGIGATLISQRPQSVNKDVLNQTECLLAFQMTGPQERKAIAGWISEKGLDAEIVNELPKLKVGECYIWSPQWLEISEKIKISPKKTADVSSTPKPGVKAVEPKQLSQIELESLSDKMLATIERAKSEDPKELRRQIADLKRELAQKPLAAVAPAKAPTKTDQKQTIRAAELAKARRALEAAMKFIVEITTRNFDEKLPEEEIRKAIAVAVNDALKKVEAIVEKRIDAFDKMKSVAGQILRQMKQILESDVAVQLEVRHNEPFSVQNARAVAPPSSRRVVNRSKQVGAGTTGGADGASNGDISLGIGERRCAIAIAQHPNGVTREQLTTLTGYKRSTRNTYLQRLTNAGLVYEDAGRFVINDSGLAWLGPDYQPLPTGIELQRYWLEKLPHGESAVLRAVLDNQANGISREEIGELTNFKRSTRNTYIQRLAARELVTVSGEIIRPSETLFEGAAV